MLDGCFSQLITAFIFSDKYMKEKAHVMLVVKISLAGLAVSLD